MRANATQPIPARERCPFTRGNIQNATPTMSMSRKPTSRRWAWSTGHGARGA